MRGREYSLRFVLVLALTLSCLFPLASVSTISYLSLRNLQQNSVANSIRAAVRQERSQMDTMVSVLDSVTQLAVMELVSTGEIEGFVTAATRFEVFRASQSLRDRLTLLSFANPDIGLIGMYDLDSRAVIIRSAAMQEPVDPATMPVLFRRNTFTAFGPHATLQKDRSDLVISAARLIPNTRGRQLYLYFEIGSRSLGAILARSQYGIPATHFVVNSEGTICYTEDPSSFPRGTAYPGGSAAAGSGAGWYLQGPYVVFPEQGAAGWRIMVAFKRRAFDAERMEWLTGLVLASALCLSASLLIAFFIWRTIYVPLGSLKSALEAVGRDTAAPDALAVRLRDYRYLMDRVADLRLRISALIEELKANEAKKRRLEVERLLFQINPHFLYNTLNNVQWLARINGQQEISAMVSDLNKILHYNIRRTGEMASVRDEVDMISSYVAIQQRRLDQHIELACSVDEGTGEAAIPRFILQPLVENAIRHGQRETLRIAVHASRTATGSLRLEVSDNGVGMSAEKLREVLAPAGDGEGEPGGGLGIRYVRSLIDMVFGDGARLDIESLPGVGTTVTIELPTGGQP